MLVGRGRVNGGDEDEGIGLMVFINVKEIDDENCYNCFT
jgi:hypothetical protein